MPDSTRHENPNPPSQVGRVGPINLPDVREYITNTGPFSKLENLGDSLWLLDDTMAIVDYMAYLTSGDTPPPAALSLWDTNSQALLSATFGQSLSLTPHGVDGNTSDCWEPTTSDDAMGRCPGALATTDADGSGSLTTSAGFDNNFGYADAGGPYAISEGDPLVLDGSASIGVTTWNWDLDNDGQHDDASGVSPSVAWTTLVSLGLDDDGVYPVGLEVDGGIYTAASTLTISNTAPLLSTSGASSISAGSPYVLNLNAVDPGNDTITGWTINWGDGTVEQIAGNPSSVTHVYSRIGFTFDILAAASDEDGTFLQNQLLVPSYDGDKLFRFEETTGAFLQAFATADDPIEAHIGPDGNLYVSGEEIRQRAALRRRDGSVHR